MGVKMDIKPVLTWAVANGEAKIIDRISMKLLPEFIKNNYKITEQTINESKTLEVSAELYNLVKDVAEKLVGSSYKEKGI